jgi:HSP20 family protein
MARNPLMPFRSGSGLLGGGDPFLSLHREMNRMFDDVLRGMPVGSGQGGSGQFVQAHMNVSETDKDIRITAELPGVSENDVDVNLDDDVLTIRGEKKFEQEHEKENFHFVERSYGTFQRSLRLPFPVDPEQVKATFENGVLTVVLPKTAQQERSRKIQIQGGRGGQAAGTGGSAQVSQAGSARAAQGQPDKSAGGAKK